MQVVINIDKLTYKVLQTELRNGTLNTWETIIAKGIPLQKHGRLVDADALMRDYGNDDIKILLDISPTILEANEE